MKHPCTTLKFVPLLLLALAMATNVMAMDSVYGLQPTAGTGEDLVNSDTLNATSTDPDAPNAYGIYADGIGNIANSGQIIASANASTLGSTFATGIYSSQSGSVLNNANISAEAQESDHAEAYGIQANDNHGPVTNSGAINAVAQGEVAASAYGILSSNAAGIDGDIINSGSVTATATSGGFARAFALFASDTGAILNDGDLTATAAGVGADSGADAFGIEADFTSGDIDTSGGITTTASATGTGYADAEGIDADDTDGVVSNSGTIATVATAVAGLAEATGIDTDESQGVDNSGTVIVSARSSGGNAKAWGLDAEETDGDVTNTETINVSAFAGTSSGRQADVWGIYSFDSSGSIRNENQIIATAYGYTAYTYAIYGSDIYGDIVNTGTLTSAALAVHSGQARGIWGSYIYGDINNSGTVTVMGSGAYDVYPVVGIDADNTGGNIINTGTIDVTGTVGTDEDAYAEAIGVNARLTTGFFLNDGSISVAASAEGERYVSAWGLDISNISDAIENAGEITVTATDMGEGAEANAYGMDVGNTEDIRNSGAVSVVAMAGDTARAFGIRASGTDGDIDNSGDITATASAHNSYAAGIEATTIAGDIINSGTIAASATSMVSGAYGIRAQSITGDIINSGDITAYAQSDASMPAYGIHAAGDGSVANTGSIAVHGDSGAGIYIQSGNWAISNPGYIFTSGGTRTMHIRGASSVALADSFRIIFSGDPADSSSLEPIYVAGASTLDLNGETLIAQADDDIVWNTPYAVIENDASTVNGEFGELQSVNPNIAVSWDDADSTGEDAAVVFNYAPKASAAAQALRITNLGVMQAGNLIQQRTFSELLARYIRQQETMLADSGQTASDSGFLVARAADGSGSAVFIRPYLHTINHPSDGDMGYVGSLLGIVAGYEWLASRELTMGLHAGLGVGSIDFKGTGYDANDEEQQVYSLGLHGAYNPGAWHFDGGATLYAANHEYEGLTGGGLTIEEEDGYTSYGAEAEAIGGYVFSSGRWAAMPYAGLGYSWINAPGHTSDADNPAWDTRYGAVDEHIVRSILGGQISANWSAGETKIIPTLGLRWEYALTDNEISVSQSLPGTGSVDVDDDVSRSSVIGDASVVFVKGAGSMELGAMSEYNADYTSCGGWLSLKWAF